MLLMVPRVLRSVCHIKRSFLTRLTSTSSLGSGEAWPQQAKVRAWEPMVLTPDDIAFLSALPRARMPTSGTG
eukprot:4452644-Alexandrium_andersonii.AAC.1